MGWRWNIFSPYLDSNNLKNIQNHELRLDTSLGDLVYWKEGSKGKLTIRLVMSIMRHETDTIDDKCWDIVWHAPVQQRIRAFLWLAFHNRILGNLNRFKRKMTDDLKCFICGAQEESTLHILRDFSAARVVWRKTLTPSITHQF